MSNALLPFLRDAPQISGSAIVRRLLDEADIAACATAAQVDVNRLVGDIAALESSAKFDTADFREFGRHEETLRASVAPAIGNRGGAFPSWRLGGRCTPLGFAMLQGFAAPRFVEMARRGAVDRYSADPLNSVIGLAAFCLRLVRPSLVRVHGLDDFVSALERLEAER